MIFWHDVNREEAKIYKGYALLELKYELMQELERTKLERAKHQYVRDRGLPYVIDLIDKKLQDDYHTNGDSTVNGEDNNGN